LTFEGHLKKLFWRKIRCLCTCIYLWCHKILYVK